MSFKNLHLLALKLMTAYEKRDRDRDMVLNIKDYPFSNMIISLSITILFNCNSFNLSIGTKRNLYNRNLTDKFVFGKIS